MEGFGEFIKTVVKVLSVILIIVLIAIAGTFYEKSKHLEKELYECKTELKIIKKL